MYCSDTDTMFVHVSKANMSRGFGGVISPSSPRALVVEVIIDDLIFIFNYLILNYDFNS